MDPATNTSRQPVLWAATGRLDALDSAMRGRLLDRAVESGRHIAPEVAAIIDRVRADGDAALLAMAREFDGDELESVEVGQTQLIAALEAIDPAVRSALEQAARAIEGFHRAQVPQRIEHESIPGVRLTRIPQPLERVGVYAPGGRAVYPSSVLMGAIPARVAGVAEVIVCSPPGGNGRPSDIVLAACAIGRVDRVFAAGGAGAIAAMAIGTATVPRVDRVVGPGNAWVTEAKRQLQGIIGIDCPAGPSEVLILADDTADPVLLAAELIAQAEHDPDAAAVLLVTDQRIAQRVDGEVASMLRGHPREPIIRTAFRSRGALLAADLPAACTFATAYAPEHLLIATADPPAVLRSVRNAGTIFLGQSSSVAFGDYITGANHVLPTGGAARSFSGLDTLDFVRWTTVQEISPAAAARLSGPTAVLADAERLPGHAFAARLRSAETDGEPDDPAAIRNAPATRPEYSVITTYDPGRKPVAIDLSDNTNLFGVCPAVQSALAGIRPATTTRYPAVYADSLVAAAAARFGVDPSSVTTGCGSDDVIDSALRAFCAPGDVVAFPWPTFGIVPTFIRMNVARPVPVEMPPGSRFDARALLDTGARVIYVCRPNNPTGDSVPAVDVLSLAHAFDGVLLVDEAYADFAEDDLLDAAVASRNVVVLRTLSKANGLAGMRIGFAIGPAPLISEITKSRGPYKVSGVAEVAGTAALGDGADWVAWSVAETKRNRQRLVESLRVMGLDPLPSSANFVLLPLDPGGDGARATAAALREREVGVRPFERLPGIGDCIRITVGPWTLMQTFLDALADVRRRDGGRE